jgi:DNA-binding NarL/FixJ family response regulator
MPLRILVVEDYAPFRLFTCEALQRRRAEFEIFEAADGVEALQKVQELHPDLILLDINLPKLHGFEVAARIGSLAPRAKLLFMSQESSSDIVRHGFVLGAHGYIHKQRAGTDLLAGIDAVCRGERFVSSSVAFSEPTDHPASHQHEVLFCSDDAALVDGLSRFIARALRVADAAIVVVAESHRNLLLQALAADGVDIDGAIDRGTYLSFDAEVAFDPAQFVDAIKNVREAAIKAGKAHPRVVVCGERAGNLWAAGRTAEAVRLEQFCCELAHDVDILCVYPIRYTNDRALESVCAAHTIVSAS